MKKLVLIFILISSVAFAITATLRNYQCDKCGTVVQDNSTPNTSGCPKGSSHHWSNLGEVGDKNYQCKKCKILVKANATPNTSGCPSGSSHSWSKL